MMSKPDISFLEWLKLFSGTDLSNKAKSATEFATMLHLYEKSYHYDDDPSDIIEGRTGNMLFSEEEANLVREIVNKIYCEELFTVTLDLLSS